MTSTDVPGLARVALPDGTTIAYRELGAGPAVLLVHGWPVSSWFWRAVMPPIAATHRVIAVDLPGHGGSDKPVRASYDADFFVDVLEQVADALGLDEIGVAGQDIGGPIAVHWALRRPERITRLALLNTLLYPEFSAEVLDFVATVRSAERRARLLSADGLAELLRRGVADPASMTPETIDVYRAPFDTAETRRALARAAIGLGQSDFEEIVAGLPSLTIPVCAVYGEDDRILGDNTATFARLRRQLPRTEVVPVPGAGHFVAEDAPARVGEVLAGFFGSGVVQK